MIVIYLDDSTISLKHRADHVEHLKQGFGRCREYGISLNLIKVRGNRRKAVMPYCIQRRSRNRSRRGKGYSTN
uniref:Reverse transcriptase domain-containing protein n=1 Tax=Picea glauca TaxID=3330 RepID=A0A101LW56_PICGL|nr:hypothetical protein ABT39_MTgene1543 [Picea glauca]QHR87823.1 hypothetical protein Q903MT_gene1835 [Picea sitchensis]